MLKKCIIPGILVGILGYVVFNLESITDYTSDLVNAKPEVVIEDANSYRYNDDYFFVQNSKDFIPYNKQDLYNIFYSIFNSGYETFTFYCPSEYTSCISDVEKIADDNILITNIGNYVHPFNNFNKIKVVTNNLGEVDVVITERMYTDEMITAINSAVDKMFNEIITEDMKIDDKILKIHDYIIDHTYYDQEKNKNSGNAYGTFIEGRAKCSGYADAMAIALTKLGVKNYKVASEKHVWNAVYLNGEWSHLDLTWDDPIVEGGATVTDTIRHKFFMIDTDTLWSYDTDEHSFDPRVYLEVKK